MSRLAIVKVTEVYPCVPGGLADSLGYTMGNTYSEIQAWVSFARCVTDHDPFQSGAHTTMPAWYVQRQLAYVLGA